MATYRNMQEQFALWSRSTRCSENSSDGFKEMYDCDPVDRLSRYLSGNTRISTSSWHAQRQTGAELEEAQLKEMRHELGGGMCGAIIAADGVDASRVCKINPDPTNRRDLKNDAQVHVRVCREFQRAETLFSHTVPRVPRFERYFSRSDTSRQPRASQEFCRIRRWGPSRVLVSERIPALAKPLREALIDLFCPHLAQAAARKAPGNKDCLVRLYLGRRRPETSRPPMFFSLRNFTMHLDKAELIRLDTYSYASQMALGLAILHWRVATDGNDCEFVLASAPSVGNFLPLRSAIQPAADSPHYLDHASAVEKHDIFPKRQTHLWLLDFDLARDIEWTHAGVRQAARAAEDNDPYFPRPLAKTADDQDLWRHFSDAYLEASSAILDADDAPADVRHLPKTFLACWTEYRREKMQSLEKVGAEERKLATRSLMFSLRAWIRRILGFFGWRWAP